MRLRVVLIRSGDGARHILGIAASFEEASALIKAVDDRWFEETWCDDYPVYPDTDPLAYYEGCDVIAEDLDASVVYDQISDDEWVKDLGDESYRDEEA
jgi:hypothetical protein